MAAADPHYYMLDCRLADAMLLSHIQHVGDQSWFSGQRFTGEPEDPVVVEIRAGYEKRGLKEFFPAQMLMRDDLVETIRKASVDNIDVYDAVIRDMKSKRDYKNFKAVNVIGVVSAADLKGTVFNAANPSRLVDADVDSLQIDPKRAGGALMFRLAETITGLVVHENVKNAVEAAAIFPNIVFHEPEHWMG